MEIIRKINASSTTTKTALETLQRPDTLILADTANRENPDKWDRGQFYKGFHDELRGMGASLCGVPCPYGDYTIAQPDGALAVQRRIAEADAKGTGKPSIQKLDLVQPGTVCIDTKSSAAELYANLKYQYEETVTKLRRAHAAQITLYYLVVDDQIVDNPEAWTYTGRTHTWAAWGELKSLIERVESAYGVQVYFCRRSDAALVLVRMLVSQHHPQEDLSTLETIAREMEYMRVAMRLRLKEGEKELSSMHKALNALAEHMGVNINDLLKTNTTREPESHAT